MGDQPLKIGIDVRELAHPDTGIGSYVLNLLHALTRVDSSNRYFLLVHANDPGALNQLALPTNFHAVPVPAALIDKIQDQIGVARVVAGMGLDLFHATHHDVTPLLAPTPLVVTVHDIAPMDFANPSRIHRSYYHALTGAALYRARAVICISQSTRARISHYFPFVARKSSVIYYGRDTVYEPCADEQRFASLAGRLGVRRPYMLYVGSFTRRKNMDNLLLAVNQVLRQRPDVQMVIVGSPNGFDDSRMEQMAAAQIQFTGRLRDKHDLRLLYSHAALLLFPSLYEGFGLPPLEAMACGCPVVTSNVSSLPEVVGDAGPQVDPHCPAAIAGAAIGILNDDELRQRFAQGGIHRARQFDWEKAARETVAVYRSTVAMAGMPRSC